MGPNGSGKSTLAYTLLGHPKYKVVKGDITLDGTSIVRLTPDKRARMGLFLAFQYPVAVQGVSIFSFLRAAYNSSHMTDPKEPPTTFEFRETVSEKLKLLQTDESILNRYLNEGVSGVATKRAEGLHGVIMEARIGLLEA